MADDPIEEEPGNQFDFKCPKCKRDDTIEIAASVWVLLTGDGSDADASEFGDHQWDDTSAARCADCKWSGKVRELNEPEAFFIQPVTVSDGDKLQLYRRLADGLSDMVEGFRLTESNIPDDYQWLVESLSHIAVADPS